MTHITVKGNPLFADATVFKSETFAEDKRFVLVTEASKIATADQLDFRLSLTVAENSAFQVQATNLTKIGKVKVQKLTFSGDKYFSVFEDGGTEYVGPHWFDKNCTVAAGCDGKASDTGDSRNPAVFVRSTPSENSFIKVSATFVLGETIPPSPVKVIGDGPGDLDFEATATTETETTGTGTRSVFTITNVQSKGPLPQTIKFYNPLEITWKYSFDKDVAFTDVGKFKTAGKTDNRVYVLLDTPPAGSFFGVNPIRRETILDVSVRSADGQSTEATAFSAIWKAFASRSMKRKKKDGKNHDDDKKMVYWGPQEVQKRARDDSQEVVNLINPAPADPTLNGVGTCKAWTQFLFTVIAVQGIRGIDFIELKPIEVKETPTGPNLAKGFLVKNWFFGKHIRTGPDGILNSIFVDTDYSAFNNPKTGNGLPNQLCVGPGTDGTLETTDLKGDDAISDGQVNTGPNGRCQTTAAATDVQLLPPTGKGFPESVGITPGNDTELQSTSSGNDHVLDNGVVFHLDPNFPFLSRAAIMDGKTDDDFKDGDTYILPRIKSQGDNNESPPLFDNHFILRYGGKFYDASYGAGPFDTVADHEKAAADGIHNTANRIQKKKDAATRVLVYKILTCFPAGCNTTTPL